MGRRLFPGEVGATCADGGALQYNALAPKSFPFSLRRGDPMWSPVILGNLRIIMIYELHDNNIIMTDIPDFNLAQTLECGQCFHFVRLDRDVGDKFSDYTLAAFDRVIRVSQDGDTFTFYNTDVEDFEKIWIPYFDLEKDYGEIKTIIASKNPELADIITENSGIRLLNQDFFETLLSFIISQNNRIPQIKKVVADISAQWGGPGIDIGGRCMHAFPTPKALEKVCEGDFRELKTGFRASYLCDAVSNFLSGALDEEQLRKTSLSECEKQLCEIKGVGPKVANCIMLFSLGRREAFPIDVWMKRVLEQVYFDGVEKTKTQLATFAAERFGEYGGFAQQYLFAYARENL